MCGAGLRAPAGADRRTALGCRRSLGARDQQIDRVGAAPSTLARGIATREASTRARRRMQCLVSANSWAKTRQRYDALRRYRRPGPSARVNANVAHRDRHARSASPRRPRVAPSRQFEWPSVPLTAASGHRSPSIEIARRNLHYRLSAEPDLSAVFVICVLSIVLFALKVRLKFYTPCFRLAPMKSSRSPSSIACVLPTS